MDQITIEESVLASPSRAGDHPLVSIGVPTFNRPLGLRRLLNTIKDQTYRNLEIIISDNCSDNPDVQSTILLFADLDQRIIHFRQWENIGLEENFNFVYRKASGSYFVWMSDDDYFEKNYVEECVNYLQNHPGTILCSGVAKYYRKDKWLYDEDMLPLLEERMTTRLLKYFKRVNNNGKFYGIFRNFQLQNKPLEVHIGCDLTFMGKLAILGKLAYVSSTAYHRSLDGNSATKKKMIRRFGLNWFKRIFFESYIAYEVARHIFHEPRVKAKFGRPSRIILTFIVFIQMNLLLLMVFFRKRFGKKRED